MALFRAYIGAQYKEVNFSDVPINPNCEFHFILSFSIDYTSSDSNPQPTDGKFGVYWDKYTLTPEMVAAIKKQHRNVKVALSIGGDSINGETNHVYFNHSPSWLPNAVSSLTDIIKEYHLDGIDINYEHFHNDNPDMFSSDIGKLIDTLKRNGTISFAYIAPFNDNRVQIHYQRLWRDYAHVIDYINFQFYANPKNTTVDRFMEYFDSASSNYPNGKILVSYLSDGSTGLAPGAKFEDACKRLKRQNKLHGIFVWSADMSKSTKFRYEIECQKILASASSSSVPAPQLSPANSGINIIRNHDFAEGSNHWSFNSCHGSIVGTYIRVGNRTDDWQGLEQDITARFNLGTFYGLRAYVRASLRGEPIIATLRLEYQGSEPEYEEIGRIKSTSGQDWAELIGRIKLNLDYPKPKKVVFYIEGPQAGVDLLVKSVLLTTET